MAIAALAIAPGIIGSMLVAVLRWGESDRSVVQTPPFTNRPNLIRQRHARGGRVAGRTGENGAVGGR